MSEDVLKIVWDQFVQFHSFSDSLNISGVPVKSEIFGEQTNYERKVRQKNYH
jgi:hypothetical protein